MPLHMQYMLGQYGWATVTLGNGVEQAETSVTYMCDPMRQLAKLAAYFFEDADTRRRQYYKQPDFISFEDEPGGLILRFVNLHEVTELTYEVCSCSDQHVAEDGRTLHSQGEKTLFLGTTTPAEFSSCVLQNLRSIIDRYGLTNYRERWIENEFPLTEYARLAALLGEKELILKL